MAVSGVGAQGASLAMQYDAAVMRKQKEVTEQQGDMAVKLIQSAGASADPNVGRALNLQA